MARHRETRVEFSIKIPTSLNFNLPVSRGRSSISKPGTDQGQNKWVNNSSESKKIANENYSKLLLSSIKSLRGKKKRQRTEGDEEATGIVIWPTVTRKMRNRGFRFPPFVMFPFHQSTRHGRFRSRVFSPSSVSHSRLKWNFTPPRAVSPSFPLPSSKKKILRPTKWRVKETQISNIRERRPVPCHGSFTTRISTRAQALALFSAGFFFTTLTKRWKKKNEWIMYVYVINIRGGEKNWVMTYKRYAPLKRKSQVYRNATTLLRETIRS